jgi:hypothetical protein
MKLTRIFNFASPWGWALGLLAVLALGWLAIAVLGGLGFRFDPFNTAEKRLETAQTTAVTATIAAGARAQEAAGARETALKVEHTLGQVRRAETIAAELTTQARAAPDANQDLDPDRRARLRSEHERLCDARPAVCASDAAAPGDAGDR